MRVFVLLFNAGTDHEGIHTLKLGDRNVVLMFEQEDDAERYAMLLEAQDFPAPTVETIDSDEVEEFCQEAGYDTQLVSKDVLATPPEANAETTDWQVDGKPAKSTDPSSKVQTEETDSEYSSAELERIRRQLEGLM